MSVVLEAVPVFSIRSASGGQRSLGTTRREKVRFARQVTA